MSRCAASASPPPPPRSPSADPSRPAAGFALRRAFFFAFASLWRESHDNRVLQQVSSLHRRPRRPALRHRRRRHRRCPALPPGHHQLHPRRALLRRRRRASRLRPLLAFRRFARGMDGAQVADDPLRHLLCAQRAHHLRAHGAGLAPRRAHLAGRGRRFRRRRRPALSGRMPHPRQTWLRHGHVPVHAHHRPCLRRARRSGLLHAR